MFNLNNQLKSVLVFFTTAFIPSSIQWFCMTLYINYCHNNSIFGIITNTLTLGSPLCIVLNKILFNITEYYILFTMSGAVLLISWLKNF